MKLRMFVLLGAALLPISVSAAIYVKIEGIKGDVTVEGSDGHEDWIVLDSMQYGQDGNATGPGVIRVRRAVDKATPQLMQALCTSGRRQHQPLVVIHRPGDKSSRAAAHRVYELEDVRIECSSSGAGDRPTEEVAFYYNKIRVRPARPLRITPKPVIQGRQVAEPAPAIKDKAREQR